MVVGGVLAWRCSRGFELLCLMSLWVGDNRTQSQQAKWCAQHWPERPSIITGVHETPKGQGTQVTCVSMVLVLPT
jgi:hypothetical protein